MATATLALADAECHSGLAGYMSWYSSNFRQRQWYLRLRG